MKLHEQQEVERVILEDANDDTADDEDEMGRPKKRRRGGEVGRDWACEEEGCEKDFKSVCTSLYGWTEAFLVH